MGINIKQFINIIDDVSTTLIKTGKQAKTPYDEILTMKPFSKMTDSGMDVLQIGKTSTTSLIDDGASLIRKKNAGNILFDNYPVFVKSVRGNLKEYRSEMPPALYKQLDDAVANNNFALTKIVKDYYAKLQDCKSLDEVAKLYPELKVAMTPRTFIKENIRQYIPKDIVGNALRLPVDKRAEYLDKTLEGVMSNELKKHKVYPEVKKILDEFKTDILEGKYAPASNQAIMPQYSMGQVGFFPAILETNSDDVVLQIIKQNFGELKSYKDIKIPTEIGEISAQKMRSYVGLDIPIFDKHLRMLLKRAETKANEFKSIAQFDKSTITSAVYTKSWQNSKLKSELSSLGKRDGHIIQAIWQKIRYPKTTIYQTEKLIDNYLINLYKTGIKSISNTNPISRYMKDAEMTKDKKMLLQRLYKLTRQSDGDNYILNSKAFQEFKKQFDIEAMTKDIESLETHYKNSFFKTFWTDFRKARFSEALKANFASANTNIELTDDILTEAMEVVLK